MATQPRFETAFEVQGPLAPCAHGRHRPKRVAIGQVHGELRTTCRDCGCVLVRTLATRQWFYSGPLT